MANYVEGAPTESDQKDQGSPERVQQDVMSGRYKFCYADLMKSLYFLEEAEESPSAIVLVEGQAWSPHELAQQVFVG